MKFIKTLLIFLFTLLIGMLMGWFYQPSFDFFDKKETESATVILERIKNVTKLVTVEGSLSEIYNYQDYYSYDISPLRKKALVRVTAKVSAGYDFDKMQVNINAAKKEIVIHNFPDPEILSVDHNLSYYDITEGVFNSFEKEDYNKINVDAKSRIVEAAKNSDLLVQATKQKENLLQMVEIMISNSGYKLILVNTQSKEVIIAK